ncbi:MAG: hypothetical protein ACK50E_03110 [Bacteroidota bacterium]
MLQTDTHNATLKHTLSKEEEESLTMTQGHSRETARRFYEIKNQEQAAIQSIEAHRILYGEMPQIKIKRKCEEEEYHPDEESEPSKDKRIKWTLEHEAYILEWIEGYKKDIFYTGKMNWRKCSNDITNDPKGWIFTSAHRDPAKLREFAKRIAKKQNTLVR